MVGMQAANGSGARDRPSLARISQGLFSGYRFEPGVEEAAEEEEGSNACRVRLSSKSGSGKKYTRLGAASSPKTREIFFILQNKLIKAYFSYLKNIIYYGK